MFNFDVHVTGGPTKIAVRLNALAASGQFLRQALGESHKPTVLIVTDTTVGDLYGATVREALAVAGFSVAVSRIPPNESSKNLDQAAEIYRTLAQHGIDRDGVILALGGGVVSDLAGFVAATWMRGVRFAILPTTLEAAIDASIGGKTAVNLPVGKNLVGAFHQPFMVVTDPACLRTLPAREVRAGVAEAVKHGLIRSEEFFSWQEAHADEILALEPAITTDFILRNLRIKADIVEKDTYERSGLRALLNLGHTIGHAIESRADYSLRHGECVALGTVASCRLSRSLGLLDSTGVDRTERLLAKFGLPVQMPVTIDAEQILETIRSDKKSRAGRVRFVLLEGIGRPVIRHDVTDEAILDAYRSLLP